MATCPDNEDERIILVEDTQSDFLVELPPSIQSLTLYEEDIEFVEADYPPIDEITILEESELIVGSPPPIIPAGDACFTCTITQFTIAPTFSQEIIDLNLTTGVENSVLFSVDLVDNIAKLYRSFLYRVVVKDGAVESNVQKTGDPIPNDIVFSRSATGVSAQYTNLHTNDVTIILRRI